MCHSTSSTNNRWNLCFCYPEVSCSYHIIRGNFYSVLPWGGVTAAVLTLDTAVDEESRKELTNRAARSLLLRHGVLFSLGQLLCSFSFPSVFRWFSLCVLHRSCISYASFYCNSFLISIIILVYFIF